MPTQNYFCADDTVRLLVYTNSFHASVSKLPNQNGSDRRHSIALAPAGLMFPQATRLWEQPLSLIQSSVPSRPVPSHPVPFWCLVVLMV